MDIIFGYGSIINKQSAEQTLQRPVGLMYEAVLLNHIRNWSAREQVIVDGITLMAAFLNIQPKNNSYINGVCFPVTPDELARLDGREKSYKRINLSSDIVFPVNTLRDLNSLLQVNGEFSKIDNVWSYVYDLEVIDPAFFLEEYYKKVLDGCSAISRKFYNQFLETTEHSSLNIKSGSYIFADPEQERNV